MILDALTQWAEIAGYLASALVFLTFCMKTLIPLRVLAILSNVAFIAYGIGAELFPVLILHAALLPLNIARTAQQIRLRNRVREAARGDVSVDHLIPFMERRRCPSGEVLFRKGDAADFMFYLASGRVLLKEVEKTLEPGELVGEIGLFAGDGRRMATVQCIEPCEICVLTRGKVERLFHENPAFGFFLTRLITNRLRENQERAEAQLTDARGAVAQPPVRPTPAMLAPAADKTAAH
ncbi:MAG: cyclic nucleotide-binding domain-containing protein [Pseudomonadota bacterium]